MVFQLPAPADTPCLQLQTLSLWNCKLKCTLSSWSGLWSWYFIPATEKQLTQTWTIHVPSFYTSFFPHVLPYLCLPFDVHILSMCSSSSVPSVSSSTASLQCALPSVCPPLQSPPLPCVLLVHFLHVVSFPHVLWSPLSLPFVLPCLSPSRIFPFMSFLLPVEQTLFAFNVPLLPHCLWSRRGCCS